MQVFMVCFSYISVSSLAGGWIEHILPPARLLTEMHGTRILTNCMYKWSYWWWTHDVRNM